MCLTAFSGGQRPNQLGARQRLGLAICRSIVDSHHGKIWLTSEEGEGTRAFLYLPLQKEEGLL